MTVPEAVLVGIGVLFFGLLALSGYYQPIANEAECQRTWGRSGMSVEYVQGVGCMLQRSDGTWIPEEAFKVDNK